MDTAASAMRSLGADDPGGVQARPRRRELAERRDDAALSPPAG
jgi:hypothetical protein